MRAANEVAEAVVVKAHARGMAIQALGHGVEILRRRNPPAEEARADLLVMARAPLGQLRQDGTLAVAALCGRCGVRRVR